MEFAILYLKRKIAERPDSHYVEYWEEEIERIEEELATRQKEEE